MTEENDRDDRIHPPKRVVTKSTVRVVAGIERDDWGRFEQTRAAIITTFEREKGSPIVLEFGPAQRKELLTALQEADRHAAAWESK